MHGHDNESTINETLMNPATKPLSVPIQFLTMVIYQRSTQFYRELSNDVFKANYACIYLLFGNALHGLCGGDLQLPHLLLQCAERGMSPTGALAWLNGFTRCI